eukprot:m.32413 g.32413  ORF g.32413 m.32413 type:complete len:298 (-) comp10885_c0_seq1:950-1843(-)
MAAVPGPVVIERDQLLFAIPKKGRIAERVLKTVAGAGLDFDRLARLDIAACTSYPATMVFLPAADIAQYVGEGNIDVGITGLDLLEESGVKVNILEKLGIGKCRLCLQAPISANETPESLSGKRIVTSFPNLARRYFDEIDARTGRKTAIKFVSGSVEAACGLGLADGIIDLVETGTTMRAAGLMEVATVMTTQAVLIANPHSEKTDLIARVHKRISGYLLAQQTCMLTYNIPRAKLREAQLITPGHESPTVTPLEDERMVSISALVAKKEVHDLMDRLQAIGAMSILQFEVSNCRI